VFSPDALIDEVLQGDLHNKVIVIHPAAVPLLGGDKTNEESYVRIGSTMKGTAAANTRRMARDPEKPTVMGQMSELLIYMRDAIHDTGTQIFSSVSMYNDAIDKGRGSMIIEGAQGFGLSVYHGMYPYVTSRDCSPAQLIMDCAVPVSYMRHLVRVGTLRTLPIRVANRYNKEGEMIGTSGPCWDDQYELDWETDLGMEPELTTVTKLPRRVFTYSKQQIESAVHICRPDLAFVNFAQYVSRDALDYIFAHLNSLSVSVGWSGWGPDSLTDIKRYLNGGA
jgi:adenylosuccinate synthase